MVAILGGLAVLTGGGWTAFVGIAAFLLLYGLFLRYGRAPLTRLLSREGEALVLLALVLFSLAAKGLGFSEGVAAFLLGMMLAETPYKDRLEGTLRPWCDVAAAVFFLDFALHVDPVEGLGQWPAALLVAVTVVANLSSGYLSGRLGSLSPRGSGGHGLMLLRRGEFSLVVVGLAASVGAIPEGVRTALAGMTSIYIVVMVLLGSLAFRHYDRLTTALAAFLTTAADREAETERQRELDALQLE